MNGSAPKFTARMSSRGGRYGGIFMTASSGWRTVILNLLVLGRRSEIVLTRGPRES